MTVNLFWIHCCTRLTKVNFCNNCKTTNDRNGNTVKYVEWLTEMSLNSGQEIKFLLKRKHHQRPIFVFGRIADYHKCTLSFTVALLYDKSVCMERLCVQMPKKLSITSVILSLHENQVPQRIKPSWVHTMEHTATLPEGHQPFHICQISRPLPSSPWWKLHTVLFSRMS